MQRFGFNKLHTLQLPARTHTRTGRYTKSYKMPIQLVLVSFGKMHIVHNYALLCNIFKNPFYLKPFLKGNILRSGE